MAVDMAHMSRLFLDALPAGEWADVRIVENPGGMMASRNLAIFAEATWLREGGRPAFLKCMLPAGENAQTETNLLASEGSLKAFCDRLRRIQIQRANHNIPLVPLLEVGFLESFGGLLVAMERVTPLGDLSRPSRISIQAAEAALHLLQCLLPVDLTPNWLHFDVCPRNIGILPGGTYVFLDPDSFYVEEDDGYFRINLPAWKSHRIPENFRTDVLTELQRCSMRLSPSTAARMRNFGLALVAAECALGSLLPKMTGGFDDWLKQWPARLGAPDDLFASFWQTVLVDAVRSAVPLDIRRVICEFQELIEGVKARVSVPVPSSEVPPDTHPDISPDIPPEPPIDRPVSSEVVGGSTSSSQVLAPVSLENSGTDLGQWAIEWESLAFTRARLRQELLAGSALDEYRTKLHTLAEEFPRRREVWLELILVAVSYQRNATDALKIADDAVRWIADDGELVRWQRIIKLWSLEEK